MMKGAYMRLILIISILLAACSTHEIRCDRQLQQINHPVPQSNDRGGKP
jgi:hypothetical protein